MPKVSILMPACNVEKFLRECMDSVVAQTLKDIEIICIDDGSRDTTSYILDAYAETDKRIKVIHKPNSGYGHSMNVGLDHATGEYVGIIETDDFAELDMFENLYNIAAFNKADVVKSNYYTYVSKPNPKSTYFEILKEYDLYDCVFRPSDHQDIFRVRPSIWTGIYRREFLVQNKIRFNETPGASYQDTSFAFQIWACAERAVLIRDAYLHYRTDNGGSSVKSAGKIFCICDEYVFLEQFLKERPSIEARLQELEMSLKYESYRWNLFRLTPEFRYAFLMRMSKEFSEAREKKLLNRRYFTEYSWKTMHRIIDDMDGYYSSDCRKELMGFDTVTAMANELKRSRQRVKELEK